MPVRTSQITADRLGAVAGHVRCGGRSELLPDFRADVDEARVLGRKEPKAASDLFGQFGTNSDGAAKAIEELGKFADRLAESTNAMREVAEGGDASEGNTDGRDR